MTICGCCGRNLMVGETFRVYKRKVRGEAAVCMLCRVPAYERGWVPVARQPQRQLNFTTRPFRQLEAARPSRVAAPVA